MEASKLLIDGRLVEGDARLDVVNPATGEVHATVGRASQRQALQALDAARRAQVGWAATPDAERRDMLRKFGDAIERHTEELARALVREQGKPLAEARLDLQYAVVFVRSLAEIALPDQLLVDDASHRITETYQPLGVVVGITPWNFPTLQAAYKAVMALVAGNSVVLKPSPTTPVTTLMLGTLAADIFPPGVFNTLTDANDLGTLLSSHPDVAKVSFTGSTATGRKVMESAASTLKRLTLELGGNDAAIVLDDADVDAIAERLYGAAFYNCGQVCIAVKRVYVPRALAAPLAERLAALASAAKVGNGLDDGVQMGPIHNATQYEKAKGYLATAHKDGHVLTGGLVDGPGYFLRPTIVADIDDGSELVQSEQFCPVLPVVAYRDLDQAIARTNASPYGLGGSVWSSDVERASGVARRIQSGTVWVNHHLHFAPNVPFGGAKQSGIGVEFSAAGIKEFMQRTVISVLK